VIHALRGRQTLLVDKILFSSVNTCGGARRVKRPRVLLNLLGERFLHTGEVVGSIPREILTREGARRIAANIAKLH
jgi:hypothetical protein